MTNEALVLDFLEWVAAAPRTHRDVMEVWRTSCPRLTVWEDAVDAGLVERADGAVHATSRRLALLKAGGRLNGPAETTRR